MAWTNPGTFAKIWTEVAFRMLEKWSCWEKTACCIGKKPVVPDFAIDMHTEEGRKLGRDFKHFLTVASQTKNNLEVHEDFKEKLF